MDAPTQEEIREALNWAMDAASDAPDDVNPKPLRRVFQFLAELHCRPVAENPGGLLIIPCDNPEQEGENRPRAPFGGMPSDNWLCEKVDRPNGITDIGSILGRPQGRPGMLIGSMIANAYIPLSDVLRDADTEREKLKRPEVATDQDAAEATPQSSPEVR